jgi:hypothetical protein
MLIEVGFQHVEIVLNYHDNQSNLKIAKDSILYHGRIKHVGIHYHYLRKLILF